MPWSSGPFPVLCLMIGSVVTRLVPDDGPPANITGFEGLEREQQRVLVASSVTFLVGLMQVISHCFYPLPHSPPPLLPSAVV